MKTFAITRRLAMVAGSAALLGACSIIPRGADMPSRPIENAPLPEPTETGLPQDQDRHRIALLVPMSGDNGAVGQSIANATTMAILDTNASNLRITAYDTAINPRDAARRALADGNKLILGPLMGENVGAVLSEARRADVPLISFSNDASIASPDVFVMVRSPNSRSAARSSMRAKPRACAISRSWHRRANTAAGRKPRCRRPSPISAGASLGRKAMRAGTLRSFRPWIGWWHGADSAVF